MITLMKWISSKKHFQHFNLTDISYNSMLIIENLQCMFLYLMIYGIIIGVILIVKVLSIFKNR